MSVRYIFNTSGEYVAFISGDNLFSSVGTWLGAIANGNEVYNTNGLKVGFVLDDDRIVRDKRQNTPQSIPRPVPPARPPVPARPLRRLRMPRLPFPYEDVFEGVRSPVTQLTPLFQIKRHDQLLGASLIANDGTFLGVVSKDALDPNSIANSFGQYGSPYSQNSIFNQFGKYGSMFSSLSPFNQLSATPPVLIKDNQMLGYLTANQTVANRFDTNEIVAWLNTL